MLKLILLLVVLGTLNYNVESAKILGIFPVPAHSHYFLGSSLMKGLAERGHDVTVISAFGEKNLPKDLKYKDLVLTGFREARAEREKEQAGSLFSITDASSLFQIYFMSKFGNDMSEQTLEHPVIQKLLKSNEKFDAVIIEQFWLEAVKGFAYKFDAPLILLSTIGSNVWVNPLVGNPAPPSYVPDLLLSYSTSMNFWQRLRNSAEYVFEELNRALFFAPAQNAIMKKYFPEIPHIDNVMYNVSLVLVNSDLSTNDPVPRVPNMIDIGGYHVKPPKKLPKDLQDILDSAKNGVIYFSMGSNLKSAQLPIELRDAILKSFSKLKETILWKWEDKELPGKPNNVIIRDWFPQQDILAHKNVKLFITHGGLLSTIEAIYHGVPMLTIPCFGDQSLNAARAEMNGYAKVVKFSELSEEKLTNALGELLTNPSYAKVAKERSVILHDKPIKPLDLANFWVEYVIRHKGAKHLRVAGLNLPWYQNALVDVIAFSIFAFILWLFILKKLFSYFFYRKTALKSEKNKKVKRN